VTQHLVIGPQRGLRLRTTLPGDKSISHRALIVAALARGTSRIRNLLESEDCLATLAIFRSMGVRIRREGAGRYRVTGRGLRGLEPPRGPLYCGNSGTTMRLLAGLLAAQPFDTVLTGDPSLSRRPMERVIAPLRLMGARIRAARGGTAPLQISGAARLRAIRYRLPVPSAQVKSAVLLAGLYADGATRVVEPLPTRNHTELFLRNTGVPVAKNGREVSLKGGEGPRAFAAEIPGDISSAAFLLVMGLLVPGSRVETLRTLWNPTRTGFVRVLKRMGARLEALRVHDRSVEWTADLRAEAGPLRGTRIAKAEIPALIDELPILMVAATQARGRTRIEGAGELRVKETDRIHSMVTQLERMGARISVRGDTVRIDGPTPLEGAAIRSYGDHRTAMSFAVAGMVASGLTSVRDVGNIRTSFPGFFGLLRRSGCRFRLLRG
jgi:3-phosphoshikimate 1-carboxyvinyltransferase